MTSNISAVRIALAVEGPTDHILIEAAIKQILGKRPAVVSYLQPEFSAAFDPVGEEGGGWPGVYRWCHDLVDMHGSQGLADNFF